MGNGNGKKLWPHNRGMSVIDADPHHALSPSYNIDEDAVPFTFSRPGIYIQKKYTQSQFIRNTI